MFFKLGGNRPPTLEELICFLKEEYVVVILSTHCFAYEEKFSRFEFPTYLRVKFNEVFHGHSDKDLTVGSTNGCVRDGLEYVLNLLHKKETRHIGLEGCPNRPLRLKWDYWSMDRYVAHHSIDTMRLCGIEIDVSASRIIGGIPSLSLVDCKFVDGGDTLVDALVTKRACDALKLIKSHGIENDYLFRLFSSLAMMNEDQLVLSAVTLSDFYVDEELCRALAQIPLHRLELVVRPTQVGWLGFSGQSKISNLSVTMSKKNPTDVFQQDSWELSDYIEFMQACSSLKELLIGEDCFGDSVIDQLVTGLKPDPSGNLQDLQAPFPPWRHMSSFLAAIETHPTLRAVSLMPPFTFDEENLIRFIDDISNMISRNENLVSVNVGDLDGIREEFEIEIGDPLVDEVKRGLARIEQQLHRNRMRRLQKAFYHNKKLAPMAIRAAYELHCPSVIFDFLKTAGPGLLEDRMMLARKRSRKRQKRLSAD